MKRSVFFLSLLLTIGLPVNSVFAVQPGVCSLDPPPQRVARANFFSEQQEQWLGDAMANMVEPQYALQPEVDSAYLTEIGQKLLAKLPPTSIHYSFRIFDSGDMRAISLAGGHIYISRKMVLDARNEDELAAMLAQEIGRDYTHHSASLVTLRLKKTMGVKSLGDQADVLDKFARLQNIPIPDNAELSAEDQKKDQLLADRVALYALIKAGYSPKAFATFLDRENVNGGFTGNFFTNLFDTTPDVSMRLRQAHQLIDALPDFCRRVRPPYRPGFKPFEDALYAQPINPFVPPTPGLHSIALDPPMNPALENVRLSLDGKYALAQDEAQIHVLSTDPLKLLFSIDARGAEMAQFTPDSTGVVFHYDSLRVETWNIAAQQPAAMLDFPDYFGCSQTSLSPDGNVFACFSESDNQGWMRLTDLRTNQIIYQKTGFADESTLVVDRAIWSPDGRYFLGAWGPTNLAYDLKEHALLKLKGSMLNPYDGRFTFVDSDKLLYGCDWELHTGKTTDKFQMCFSTFPDGKTLGAFSLGYGWLAGVARGAHALTGPYGNWAAVLLDPVTGAVGQGFKLETVDLAGDTVATEAYNGGLSVGKLGGVLQTASLPATPLPSLETGVFSADGRFLAISDRARSAVWDLATGKQTALTRPFRVAAFDENDHLQARVIDQELKPSGEGAVDWRTHKMAAGLSVGGAAVQFGSVLLQLKPTKDIDVEGDDATTGARLWSRRFSNGVPEIAQTDGDQLLLVFGANSDSANDDARHFKNLFARTSDAIKKYDDQGLLIEVVARRTGQLQHILLTPAIPATHGEGRTARLYGDLLAVRGGQNNTVVYRVSDGARLMAFFGQAIAGDSGLGLIAARNRLQELSIYTVATGKELQHLTLDQRILAARIIPQKRQLMVLTASQHVYTIDLPPSAVAANAN